MVHGPELPACSQSRSNVPSPYGLRPNAVTSKPRDVGAGSAAVPTGDAGLAWVMVRPVASAGSRPGGASDTAARQLTRASQEFPTSDSSLDTVSSIAHRRTREDHEP